MPSLQFHRLSCGTCSGFWTDSFDRSQRTLFPLEASEKIVRTQCPRPRYPSHGSCIRSPGRLVDYATYRIAASAISVIGAPRHIAMHIRINIHRILCISSKRESRPFTRLAPQPPPKVFSGTKQHPPCLGYVKSN